MKEIYTAPEMEIVMFESEDVIVTSFLKHPQTPPYAET